MRILVVSDLHYTLRQLDWVAARAGDYDQVVTNETGEVERTAAEIEAIIAQEKNRSHGRRIRIA